MTLITQSLTLAAGLLLGADTCAEAQLTTTVWNPAANPSGNGLWSESANWTGGLVPNSTNKVVLNVSGARACRVSSAVMAGQVVVGDNGPGGTRVPRVPRWSSVVLGCGFAAPCISGFVQSHRLRFGFEAGASPSRWAALVG